jgi:uncharacterized membrane protein YedE/YeeE
VRDTVGSAITGILLGFALSRIGFSSWDEVHRMFTFADLRLLFTFMFAVALLALAWRVVLRLSRQRPSWPERAVHKGTVAGGVLFGVGWALSGACPGVALVQLGEGQLGALWTLGGILVGNHVYAVVHEKYLRWPAASCADD